ncbi:MAG: pilus assembly protein TadG-related protein, partial [Sphingobium yanoikuyae]
MKFRNLFLSHDGSVSVVAALSLIGVIGMAGLAVDLNRGYERRIATQRVADMAALAAAVAYKADGSQAILRPTAVDLVTAHGITDATIDVALLADTPEAG